MLLSNTETLSAILKKCLNGTQLLQPCGLQYPYLRLASNVATAHSRLGTKCEWSSLFRLLFQQLVIRHFRGALLSDTNYERFIASKNASFVFVVRRRSIKNSIAASSSIGCSNFLKIHSFCRSSGSTSSSSRLVPEGLISIDG